jgi:DNA-directed RNA polymerase subunit RPC12/RpoP
MSKIVNLNDKHNQKMPAINIDPNDLEDIKCQTCGGKYFYAPGVVIGIKKISALLSPNGEEGNVAYTPTVCVKCGTALEDKLQSPKIKL